MTKKTIVTDPARAAIARAIICGNPMFGLSFLVQPRFGAHVRSWRARSGYTLRQLAEISLVPMTTLIRVEKGYDVALSTATLILAWGISTGLADEPEAPEDVLGALMPKGAKMAEIEAAAGSSEG